MSDASAAPSLAPAPAPATPPPPEPCANCGAVATEKFCAHCGQKAGSTHVSLGHLLHEFVDDYFHLDSKLFRTVLHLLWPGHLTREFLKGRRMSYVGPFKLYLTASVLFFFCWAVFDRPAQKPESPERLQKAGAELGKLADKGAKPPPPALPGTPPAEKAAELTQQVREELATDGVPVPPAVDQALPAGENVKSNKPAATEPAPSGLTIKLKTGDDDGLVIREAPEPGQEKADIDVQVDEKAPSWLKQFGQHAKSFFNQSPGTAKQRLDASFVNYLPRAMFLLLPIFALLLKVLYRKSDRYYPEHFVFALHVHALYFVTRILELPLRETFLGTPLLLAPLAYLFFALRAVYGGSWIKTAVKQGLLLSTYGLMVVMTMGGIVVWTIWTG